MRGNTTHCQQRRRHEKNKRPLDVVGTAHGLGGDDWSVNKDDDDAGDDGTEHTRTQGWSGRPPQEGGHLTCKTEKGSDPFTGFHCNVRA